MSMEQALEVVLQKSKTGNQQYTREAEDQVKAWEAPEFYATYAYTLACYLATPTKQPDDRILCAVLLRGTLYAKDPEVHQQKAQKWLQTSPDAKLKVKQACVAAMNDPIVGVANQAAQVVAKIGLVELPAGQWPDLIPNLLTQATEPLVPKNLKKTTLDAFGYLCEGLGAEDLKKEERDQILTAVIHGMRVDETDNNIKLAACNALFLALNFCKKNFENPQECKVVMEFVIAAMAHEEEDIAVQSYAILTQIASQHYDKLAPFMNEIFKTTLAAMAKGDKEENITMMAIEFWCTICDEELNIQEETEYCRENGIDAPARKCQHFIKGALQYVIQLLTACLTLQDLDVDHDECTIPVAATVCLTLIAQCVKDDIIPHIVPFIERHIGAEDWKLREASLLAFGAILEGPNALLQPLLVHALPTLIGHLKDPVSPVKDTTAWALGNILKLHHKTTLQQAEPLVKNLCETLGDPSPRVASKACTALHNLAQAYEEEDDNPLAKHFVTVVRMLLLCADRTDSHEEHLVTSAYESLNMILDTAPESLKENLLQIVRLMLDRVKASFAMECLSPEDTTRQNQLQGLLCGVLQVLTQKLDIDIAPFADEIMMQVILLFRSKRDSGVYEEGLLVVGAIANVAGPSFNKYMPDLLPHLIGSLAATSEYQVCNVAVGVVGDIARALGPAIQEHSDKIVQTLLDDLKNKDLDRSVKPSILSAFGDIALAVGPYFEKYVEAVLMMLKQAAETVMKTVLKPDDFDLIEYINLLREGICEAYTASIQSISQQKGGADKISQYLPALFSFISHVARDPLRSEAVTRGAVGIIGDLATTFTIKVKPFMQQATVQELIKDCYQNSDSKESKEVAAWAQQVTNSL